LDKGSIDHFPIQNSKENPLESSSEEMPWHIANFQSEIRRGENSAELILRKDVKNIGETVQDFD